MMWRLYPAARAGQAACRRKRPLVVAGPGILYPPQRCRNHADRQLSILAHSASSASSAVALPPRYQRARRICVPNSLSTECDIRRTLSTSTTTTAPPAESFFSVEQQDIMEQCRQLHDSMMPLNDKLHGPLAPYHHHSTTLPFVLLVGNHSSGKSTFINHVLGRAVQTTGVAPTDDAFTIIAPSRRDRDQDGPSLVGDPDLGLAGLRQFGPTLLHHTVLKLRTNIQANFIMVDSPGMIDSPAQLSGMLMADNSMNHSGTMMDRGYDFTGVVRWYAQRADIVCLFFDPDKPGTTGETLSVLLHALSNMDHKLLIILNKADQFTHMHDFARAYGSLCWNLSKVMPRKDLPRIYTMCLPHTNAADGTATATTSNNGDSSSTATTTTTHISLATSLNEARQQVVAAVRTAPARRLDNVVTQLHDTASMVRMQAVLTADVRARYRAQYWRATTQQIAWTVLGGSGTAALSVYGGSMLPWTVPVAVGATTMLGLGGLVWYHGNALQQWQNEAITPPALAATFARVYARSVSTGDEFVAAIWQSIRDGWHESLAHEGIANLPAVSPAELEQVEHIIAHEVPRLRRLAAPPHPGQDYNTDRAGAAATKSIVGEP